MSQNEARRPGHIVVAWWRALHPDEDGGGDRAAAARLRRANTLHDVMVVPEAMLLHRRLCEAMGCERMSAERFEIFSSAVAIIAGVLAAVKPGADGNVGDNTASFAAVLGRTAEGKRPGESERPLYSSLRFASLLRASDPEDRLRHLRRAAAQIRARGFDVVRFADDMLNWKDEARRRWIFQYHQQGRAAPQDTDTHRIEKRTVQ
ncbi:MAG: type I-E CRISPR-associated protein Cse2/CasB [Rhodospirillaceae bacterium]